MTVAPKTIARSNPFLLSGYPCFFFDSGSDATYDTVKTVKIKACTAPMKRLKSPQAAPGSHEDPAGISMMIR